jgi:hypothetical protein
MNTAPGYYDSLGILEKTEHDVNVTKKDLEQVKEQAIVNLLYLILRGLSNSNANKIIFQKTGDTNVVVSFQTDSGLEIKIMHMHVVLYVHLKQYLTRNITEIINVGDVKYGIFKVFYEGISVFRVDIEKLTDDTADMCFEPQPQ